MGNGGAAITDGASATGWKAVAVATGGGNATNAVTIYVTCAP